MKHARITIASHHFVITESSATMKRAIAHFSRPLIIYKEERTGYGRQVHEVPDKVYAAATKDRREHRYHINHLEAFKKHCYNYYIDNEHIEWATRPMYEPDPMDLVMNPVMTPRERQPEAIEYILNPGPPCTKAVVLQTGKGKTFVSMYSASKLGHRVCGLLQPRYIEQWLDAFKENCVIDMKRIVVIRGGKALRSLMYMAENVELPYDIILISAVTFREYIKDYEESPEHFESEGFTVTPDNFFEHLGIGMRLVDEAHEDFHLQFKLDLYTHVPKSVILSATLFDDDKFTNSMMEVAYPKATRYDTGEYDKYAYAYSWHYNIRSPREIRCKQPGRGSYSHIEFEKSLMKHSYKVENYFQMTLRAMELMYNVDYAQGHRCLVYFATIEMCTRFKDWMINNGYYSGYDVRRFVEDDPFENLRDADISVSTLKSAGTGKDIKQLTTVILTVAVNSSPSNLQGFGRLRKLKDGSRVRFLYFVCDDLPKQVQYHETKKELLRTRALAYEPRYYTSLI